MDPISLTEIFVTTYHVGEKGVDVDFEASNHIIVKDNNKEIKNVGFREYSFHFYNNELYIVFRFKIGLLMNHSLFGQTDEFVFRFDFHSKELIYLGNAPEYVHYIYH